MPNQNETAENNWCTLSTVDKMMRCKITIITIIVNKTIKICMPFEHFRFVDNLIHSFATKYIRHADKPSFCWYCLAYWKILKYLLSLRILFARHSSHFFLLNVDYITRLITLWSSQQQKKKNYKKIILEPNFRNIKKMFAEESCLSFREMMRIFVSQKKNGWKNETQ